MDEVLENILRGYLLLLLLLSLLMVLLFQLGPRLGRAGLLATQQGSAQRLRHGLPCLQPGPSTQRVNSSLQVSFCFFSIHRVAKLIKLKSTLIVTNFNH